MGMTKVEQLLCELIALPSVNPAFLPLDDPRAGEKRVGEFVAVEAAKAGLDIEVQEVIAGRSNVLARLAPSGKVKNRVLLAPHLDTVVAEDGQFSPRLKNGRLYGRGACDTKGSVAAMLSALCDVARGRQRPRETEIVFAGLVDEENAQAGSRALAASGMKAELAIVGEATRLQVATAHKGILWLSLTTEGKAAHGSKPELGRNAVHEMALVVQVLETEYAKELGRRRHSLLGRATVNVGTIAGGRQPNIVPDRCEIVIDRRTLPGESERGVVEEISRLLRRKGLKVKFGKKNPAACLPMETDARLPWVERLMRSVRQRRPAGVDYFCDAAILAEGGIPSVVFGPGDIAQMHTEQEWISTASLGRAQGILRDFLEKLP
jgi:acetylornithine deacetylase/succinyl-diaminopimelate desuccinylase-like protein